MMEFFKTIEFAAEYNETQIRVRIASYPLSKHFVQNVGSKVKILVVF